MEFRTKGGRVLGERVYGVLMSDIRPSCLPWKRAYAFDGVSGRCERGARGTNTAPCLSFVPKSRGRNGVLYMLSDTQTNILLHIKLYSIVVFVVTRSLSCAIPLV
jgi:hypothetical protein